MSTLSFSAASFGGRPRVMVGLARSRRAFTLVEVAMSLGIIAFAFVSIFGLIPVGMTTFRRTMDVTVGSQIAQKVIGDAVETDFDTLTADSGYTRDGANNVVPANFTFRATNPNSSLSGEQWRYFDEQGNEILQAADKTRALYYVLTRINPQAPLPDAGAGTGLQALAQVTVQVVTNPSKKAISVADTDKAADQTVPMRNLVDTKAPGMSNVSIYTCTALIAKNK